MTLHLVQDEAAELIATEGQSSRAQPEEALAYLAQHCELAVVTLGDKGCIAKRKGEQEVVQEPACSGVTVIDATGLYTHTNCICGTVCARHAAFLLGVPSHSITLARVLCFM